MEGFVIFLPSKNSQRANIVDVSNQSGHKGKKSFHIPKKVVNNDLFAYIVYNERNLPTKIVGIVSAHGRAQM